MYVDVVIDVVMLLTSWLYRCCNENRRGRNQNFRCHEVVVVVVLVVAVVVVIVIAEGDVVASSM